MNGKSLLFVILTIAILLTACGAPSPAYPTCLAHVAMMSQETKIAESDIAIPMKYKPGVSDITYATYEFVGRTAEMASQKIEDAIGFKSPFPGTPEAIRFDLVSGSENLDKIAPDVVSTGDTSRCPASWTITYRMFAYSEADVSKPGREWEIAAHASNGTGYFTIFSTGGSVEVPISEDTLTQLVTGKYDPQESAKSVSLLDPAVQVGADSYEQTSIRTALRISSEGAEVGRFRWDTLEAKDMVNHILAHALILKAWEKHSSTVQAAWIAYLGNAIYRSTNLSVQSRDVSGNFFLGIGSVSGGGSTSTFSEIITTSPTVFGELYVQTK